MPAAKDVIRKDGKTFCPHCKEEIKTVIETIRGTGVYYLSNDTFDLNEITNVDEQECPKCSQEIYVD